MSKKSVTYVERAKLITIVESKGLSTKENAGFVQVQLGNGYNLYVAKTIGCARVDLQWLPEGVEGVTTLGEGEKIGRVVAQLDFSRTEEQILTAFAAVLDNGMSLGAWERPKRVQPGTVKAKQEAAPATEEEVIDRKAERRRLIEDQAKKMGASISEKADI